MSDPGLKKVLILTYYWPPSGGAGVQRWLKFTKYLGEFGFEPIIYTAANPEYPSIDESLYKDIPGNITVLKKPVWEPYRLYKWFTFQKKGHRINAGFLNQEKKKGITERISVWIRGNLFIPDARRFWVRPSVNFLAGYLREHPVDLVVSTGPPHSMHLIGLGVSRRTGIPWVADFRDPWTKIDYFQDLMLSRRAERKHLKLEKAVMENASAVTVISEDMKRQFEEMGAKNLHVITNGFDPEDFSADTGPASKTESGIEADDADQLRKFSLTHIGTIVPTRNPDSLWKALSELVRENEDFARVLSVNLIGAVDYSVSESIDREHLGKWVDHKDYLPHSEISGMLKASRILLLLINDTPNAKGILTGKFFEYLNSGRPILAIGPTDGEASRILDETGTGKMVDFQDTSELKKQILEYYETFCGGKLTIKPSGIGKYSRKSLTEKMAEVFITLTEQK